MKFSKTIQKSIAFFLLFVFAFGAMPKPFLHDAFANHKDVSYSCKHVAPSTCVHQQGYNCHFDNLVVNSDYLFEFEVPAAGHPLFFEPYFTSRIFSHYATFISSLENKGPPSIA